MKARVKGTNNIIDVEFDKDAFKECYPPYLDKENNMFYQPEQLEWLDNEENAEPNYWERLKHQYAGMAMQAMLTSPELMQVVTSAKELLTNDFAKRVAVVAARYAHALVEELKEKEE
jgi:hypothetical protein